MAPATSGRGSRTATTCCPRWPAGWRPGGASWKTSSATIEAQQRQAREADEQAAEEAAITYVIEQLGPEELERLVAAGRRLLPEPIVRRNPTLSNPFVRGKVYELACGEPVD